AIDFHNTAQKTIVEAALDEAKETEEEAARAVETAKADVAVKAARLRPAEQNFNAAKRSADQAPKQSPQRNNDVLQAAAKAAKLEVSLSEARALLARTETAWIGTQETLRRTSDLNAKEKAAKDAERAAIERFNAAQKVAELSEALRDVSIAEADFSAAAKVAARDVLYATTVAKDATTAAGVSARAKAEREAADNKRAVDERAARAKTEKEAAARNRADAIARENVEAAFNNAIRTKTEAAWLAAKNIATTAYNASRENKTLFEEKKGIAHNKVAFFQAKRLFISCIRDAKYAFTNIPKNKCQGTCSDKMREEWFKDFKDGAFNESFDDLRRYLYQVDINSDAYKKAKKSNFLIATAGGGYNTGCYEGSYYVFDSSDQTISSAVRCAQKAMENSVQDARSLGFSSYSGYLSKECKKNIEALESHSTRTAGTIWEEEVQWLLLSAKEVVNDSEAAIVKANASCTIM
ncbi:MAG TPA: hypothetical protein VJK54_04275, partial [Chthoniobacterales bacterium]|nr:hypothetical protein [Chthoniobacterales bacterium]